MAKGKTPRPTTKRRGGGKGGGSRAYVEKAAKLVRRSGKGLSAGNIRRAANSSFRKEGPSAATSTSSEPK